MEWRVICVTCGKEHDRAPNGVMMDSLANLIKEGTLYGKEECKGHDLVVGYTAEREVAE